MNRPAGLGLGIRWCSRKGIRDHAAHQVLVPRGSFEEIRASHRRLDADLADPARRHRPLGMRMPSLAVWLRVSDSFPLRPPTADMTRTCRRGAREKNLTFCEAFGCSHVFGLFSLGGLPPAMRPLWPLALM
jgi:hypothetical protein